MKRVAPAAIDWQKQKSSSDGVRKGGQSVLSTALGMLRWGRRASDSVADKRARAEKEKELAGDSVRV